MRKKKQKIVDKALINSILETGRIGRLGTNGADGFPYIVPVNYVFWRESVYFHCAREGEKLDNIKRDPRVCFEIDLPLAYLDTKYDKKMSACDVNQFYQSIIIRGRAELINDIEEKVGALNSLLASHEKTTEFKTILPSTRAVALCSVIAVRVESISAKGNLAQNKSPEEKDSICMYLQKRNSPGDRDTITLIQD